MKEVYFSIREYPEVLALATIMSHCVEMGVSDIEWCVFCSPVNTDFNFLSLNSACDKMGIKVRYVSIDEVKKVNKSQVFGFKTDMLHEQDEIVGHFFDIFNVMATRLYRHKPLKVWNKDQTIVLGNIKIKLPVAEFQQEIFARLAVLPYTVVVIPRHPFKNEELGNVNIPSKLNLINTMGDLEKLHAHADAVIMGRIFCEGDLVSDDDHNPFEATINAGVLAGINTNIPDAYKWIYNDSELIHQCESYDEVFDLLPVVLNDKDIVRKLARRKQWIMDNRRQLLDPVLEMLSIHII